MLKYYNFNGVLILIAISLEHRLEISGAARRLFITNPNKLRVLAYGVHLNIGFLGCREQKS